MQSPAGVCVCVPFLQQAGQGALHLLHARLHVSAHSLQRCPVRVQPAAAHIAAAAISGAATTAGTAPAVAPTAAGRAVGAGHRCGCMLLILLLLRGRLHGRRLRAYQRRRGPAALLPARSLPRRRLLSRRKLSCSMGISGSASSKL